MHGRIAAVLLKKKQFWAIARQDNKLVKLTL